MMLLCLLGAGMTWMPMTAAADYRTTQITAVPDDNKITGVIEDADGPMIGATIKVVDSNVGTVTDLNGKFSIKCKPGDMLEISYVGYTTIKVKAQMA